MKKILTITTVILTVILAAAGSFIGWFKYQTREMSAIQTGPVGDGISAVKGMMSNFFLLKAGDGYIAFDAGENPKKVRAGLQMLGIDPQRVTAVFLTHSDGDHAGGLPVFPNAAVYLSKDEVPMITRITPRHFFGISHYNKLSVSTYQTLGDGDSVVLNGVMVKGISTPGHTPGSMSYLANGTLFTGDLCILVKGEIRPMIKLFTEDMAVDVQSIRKIAVLPGVRRICTAHSGFTTDIIKAFDSRKE